MVHVHHQTWIRRFQFNFKTPEIEDVDAKNDELQNVSLASNMANVGYLC